MEDRVTISIADGIADVRLMRADKNERARYRDVRRTGCSMDGLAAKKEACKR